DPPRRIYFHLLYHRDDHRLWKHRHRRIAGRTCSSHPGNAARRRAAQYLKQHVFELKTPTQHSLAHPSAANFTSDDDRHARGTFFKALRRKYTFKIDIWSAYRLVFSARTHPTFRHSAAHPSTQSTRDNVGLDGRRGHLPWAARFGRPLACVRANRPTAEEGCHACDADLCMAVCKQSAHRVVPLSRHASSRT